MAARYTRTAQTDSINGGLQPRGPTPPDCSKSRHCKTIKIIIQNLNSKKIFVFQIVFNIYDGPFHVQMYSLDPSKIRSISISLEFIIHWSVLKTIYFYKSCCIFNVKEFGVRLNIVPSPANWPCPGKLKHLYTGTFE